MPSIKTITPILGGSYYHIFNCGINKQIIFFEDKNYIYFLNLMRKYLVGNVDILAFCLLPNHFHLVIKVKDEIRLNGEKDDILKEKDDILSNEIIVGDFVSNQFRRLFIAYSMAINKQERRTGNFFDRSFKRLEITKQDYLEYAIFYAHYNPEKHGLATDFRDYKYSSYKAILAQAETNVCREFVLDLFGGDNEFLNYHSTMHGEREGIILE